MNYPAPPNASRRAERRAVTRDANRRRARTAFGYPLAAGALHLLTIPITLVALKGATEVLLGYPITWDRLWAMLAETGGMSSLVAGILTQVALAGIALVVAVAFRHGIARAAVPLIAAGIAGVVVSEFVLGGIAGLIAGLLSIAGGLKARPRRPPPEFAYTRSGYGLPPSPPTPPPSEP